jgi:hypothetical protein
VLLLLLLLAHHLPKQESLLLEQVLPLPLELVQSFLHR